MKTIRGEKIFLRPICSDDTDNILRWRNSDHIRNNFIYQKPVTREDHERWLETRVATGEVIQFIIITEEGKHPIGSVYLRDVDRKEQRAEYGIFIGETEALGKGYGTEALRLMLRFAFEELHLKLLTLRVLARNVTARGVYEKAGFLPDPDRRDSAVINGKSEEILFYRKNSPEA